MNCLSANDRLPCFPICKASRVRRNFTSRFLFEVLLL